MKVHERSILIRVRDSRSCWHWICRTQPTAKWLEVERHCVGRWRKLRQVSVDASLVIELNEPRTVLRRSIIDDFRDPHRSGCLEYFSPQQVVQVIVIGSQSSRKL
jgi:hypothetical protein